MVESGKKEQNGLLPIPKSATAKVAFDFAVIAKKDFLAAKILYREKLYAQAVYALQQSVEKSAKAFGLMLGILKINEVRSVSHRSVYALLIGMESFSQQLTASVNWLTTSNDPTIEKLRSIGLDSLFSKLPPMIPSAKS